jgi:D-alanyl-D-alanine carboxypeptidase
MILALTVAATFAAHPYPSGVDRRSAQSCTMLKSAQRRWDVIGFTAAYIDRSGRSVEFALGEDALGKSLRPGDKFLSGSVGKTFVAALALSLSHQHRISLDSPTIALLGKQSWFRKLPNSDRFTLRQLLTHTSGLPSHVGDPRFQRAISARIRACPTCVFSPAEAITFVEGKRALFPAGQGWEYSETGYLVAGKAIEAATGEDYYALLRRLILQPLKLQEIVPSNRNYIARLVAGKISPGSNYFGMLPRVTFASGRLRYNPAFEWTGGGVAASTRDLARWARLLYGGRAFRHPYLDELSRGVTTGNGRLYGLGVSIAQAPNDIVYGHTGSIPGYSSAMFYHSGSSEAVAVQTPQDVDTDGYSRALSDTVLAAGRAFAPNQADQAVTCT